MKKRSIEQFKDKVLGRVFEAEASELRRPKRLLRSLVKIFLLVSHDFIEKLVKLQAMALAFKTLLSLAPLLAVVFAILKAFGVHNRMEPALAEALAPLGEQGREITHHLITFVDRMQVGALGSVGLAALFVTVLSLMGTIEESFNHIWRVKSPRKITRKFSDYLSVILVGPVLVFAAVTVTATLQSNTFVQKLMSLEPFGTMILTLLKLAPYLALWGAFTFVYVFVPNTRVKLKAALVGGLVAAILWQTVGWGFAAFVASSPRYDAIYSSFAILLLFLLWLHVGWVIVLLGAQVAYVYQHLDLNQEDREVLAATPAGREQLALHLMYLVGRNFYHGLEPMSISELAHQLGLPAGFVSDFMEIFHRGRLVLPLADEETFVLGRNPETIGVKDILDCLRNAGAKPISPGNRTKEEQGIEELFAEIDHSLAKVLEGKNLQSLILSQSPPRR